MLTTMMIGDKIADARKRKLFSQTQLAGKLSVSPQAVGKWERGESMPDLITFNRLAEILDVDMNYFSENFQSLPTVGQPTAEELAVPPEQPPKPRWNMSGGVWADADFSGLHNLGEKFSGANIEDCLFVGSELSGLMLNGNNMIKNDFSRSDLSDSQIKGANLVNNQFQSCAMRGALFLRSYLKDCDFSGSDFTGTAFRFCSLSKITVTEVLWNGTAFHNTHLTDMVLDGAFTDCAFDSCGFTRTTFQNAVFTNTFFKNNKNLKKVKFVDCRADSLTYAFLKNGKAEMSGITLINAS